MKHRYRWDEINQLGDLLEAEIVGHQFDRHRAHHLALTLAEQFPDMAKSMRLVADRMGVRT
ncbi:conserved hypothetical protein [Candidatus Terasakiella magnetica]|nr:conserved hypothetical protein [Candidatus Terasakiella magnetica]